jgi:hypothetical protein
MGIRPDEAFARAVSETRTAGKAAPPVILSDAQVNAMSALVAAGFDPIAAYRAVTVVTPVAPVTVAPVVAPVAPETITLTITLRRCTFKSGNDGYRADPETVTTPLGVGTRGLVLVNRIGRAS